MRQALIAVVATAMLAGCGGRRVAPEPGPAAVRADWRSVATAADRDRLRRWRSVWLDAVGRARAGGASREIAAQGALFDPDLLLADPAPPTGEYRCRVFKLGAKRAGLREYVTYPAHACRVLADRGMLRFQKIGGSQRPVGRIFRDPGGRAVFLGTLVLGDETRAIDYGRDSTRDMAGFVDRVGERRWRIMLPQPAFESTFDVIELVPAA
jgi:hypothetical protein